MLAFEEMIGNNGLQALLNLAHIEHYIDDLPPANLENSFDFADFSALFLALEEMYGQRGGRGLALRSGRITFRDSLSKFGAFAGTGDLAFKILPLKTRLRIALPAMAKIFSEISDQRTTVSEKNDAFHYTVHRNPICWGRQNEENAICFFHVGLLEEAMHQISGGSEFRVDEAQCQASGSLNCNFIIQKEPIS